MWKVTYTSVCMPNILVRIHTCECQLGIERNVLDLCLDYLISVPQWNLAWVVVNKSKCKLWCKRNELELFDQHYGVTEASDRCDTSPTHKGSATTPRGVNGVLYALQASHFHNVTVSAHAAQQICEEAPCQGPPSYQTWPSFSSSSSLV